MQFDIALTISLALVSGLIGQTFAHHLRIPGIVLLLFTGALLGPQGIGIINPEVYHESLTMLVGFAVAVILFEGGLNLDIKRLRRESIAIRQLITIGLIITVVGAGLAAHYILNWSWEMSFLFGTLVSVTGPTVVTPILRRIKLNKNISTVLEAEGVLIDPIGAIVAIVALELVMHPGESSFLFGTGDLLLRLGFGFVFGLIGGVLISLLLRPKKLIPENLKNIFVLTFVLAMFHLSNTLMGESGIVAVTIAGVVLGNAKTKKLQELAEFKEQLTMMFIAMLFVLLAADVSFADIKILGQNGVIVVLILMFLVRPINVFVSTLGTKMALRDKLFLSWMAPRGIVAAAVASFFAVTLEEASYEGGNLLRAMVFLVIAITVTTQGITGGLLAKLLKVSRSSNKGYIIVGAHAVSIEIANAMKAKGEEITFVDSNADAVRQIQESGYKVIFGNGLDDSILIRAGIDSVKGCVGLTPNEEINLLFVQKASEEYKIEKLYAYLHIKNGHVKTEMIEEVGADLLFGAKRDIDLWNVRIRRNLSVIEKWRCTSKDEIPLVKDNDSFANRSLLPLVVHKKNSAEIVTNKTKVKSGDEVVFAVYEEKRAEVKNWFNADGWVFVLPEPEEVVQDLT